MSAAGIIAPEHQTAEHDVSSFDSGTPELDNWLKRRALANEALGTSRTYVVTEGGRVDAFYALANGAVAHKDVSAKTRRNMPDPIPVMVLARVAVDSAHQKQGLGSALLKDALLRTIAAAKLLASRDAASCDVRRRETLLCTCRISRESGRSNDDDDHARRG
jgi:GNAT superfamily N-acetyltransferase